MTGVLGRLLRVVCFTVEFILLGVLSPDHGEGRGLQEMPSQTLSSSLCVSDVCIRTVMLGYVSGLPSLSECQCCAPDHRCLEATLWLNRL